MVENREVCQTARDGQAGTSGVLLNAQSRLGVEGLRCGKTPPPKLRHTPGSLSLPFLFPLRPARNSTREGTRPPAPGRGLPPTSHLGHSQYLRPLSSEGKVVIHTYIHIHACIHAHTYACMHILGTAQLGGTLGIAVC